MSGLEQSLDAIIASSSKDRRPTARKGAFKGSKRPIPTRVGKRSTPVVRRPEVRTPNRAAALALAKRRNISASNAGRPTPRPAVVNSSLGMATKVIVSGLPKDIKSDAIQDFFSSQVGPVNKVIVSYNEKGRSSGVATVIFKNAATAQRAVAKYHNAPIDQGRTVLRLELIVDPTKKPLASRITPNKSLMPTQPSFKTKIQQKRQSRIAAVRGPAPRAKTSKDNNAKPAKPQKYKKKSLAELDQEMAEYFANNDSK